MTGLWIYVSINTYRLQSRFTYTKMPSEGPDLGEDGLTVPDRANPGIGITYTGQISLREERAHPEDMARIPICICWSVPT
jgi:hypothetical protein